MQCIFFKNAFLSEQVNSVEGINMTDSPQIPSCEKTAVYQNKLLFIKA